jgi:serine/threonine protein kinase/formylglycine-generating enzyme required for sulfatase activity
MNDPNPTGPYQPATVNEAAAATPQRIGRYRVEKTLGQGGFGLVYLAHDDQLQRLVAIKVPHRKLVSRPEDAEAYLTEARIVAALDHPHIVPVYDVGSTEEFPCFVVSKYMEGDTLAQRIKENRPSVAEAAELVATVAEALHHAHKQGLVHRDIKPGNILLDKTGKPFVGDFGLALREQDVGKGPRYAGTPAYMSPEQARGEGHRVDGRSDIFSLGIVLYELLTGRRPFKDDSQESLLEQIATHEARPPRQIDDAIPKELDRICLKAVSKRASERYSTARDMADDLRQFLAGASAEEKSVVTGREKHEAEVATPIASPVLTPSDQQVVKIVPKGLRSFDAHDAEFFLELLPGPRDREGLPDSIRFWKTRIEEMDSDNTFSVGLIYGPSGCGKSSLAKAGLLPRLSGDVIAVYVEATAEDTETRLLNGLRKRCSTLPDNLGLKETLAALRRGEGIPVAKKVVIVLDQFEQWLHAKKEEENTDLVQALRQCDGGRVQCIAMVRDDFWMAVTRFLRELEIDLVPGRNTAAADLFDLRHTKKVLTAFGRAFGTLPEHAAELTNEQKAFVEQAVSGLAQEGKIVCVRLALFAEMMKGRPWTPASFKEVGGTEGVGVTFLEETFASQTANPKHRLHQKGARTVLKALLPESGTDIKGHMRSHVELLEASGYGSHPNDFDDLIRILDSEIRLITPTDPEGKDGAAPSTVQAGAQYYQLTHDYLVHSLRDWLTRKQKETRRGRAELLLADRAAVWNARSENRQLPSLLQWFQIKWFTQKKNWPPPQLKMMRKATRYHAVRGLAVAVLIALIGLGSWEGIGRLKAQTLRDRLLEASTPDVPGIVKEMAPYRRWLDPLLHDAYALADASKDARKQLHASLALLPVDSEQVEYLYRRLIKGEPQDVIVIRGALLDHNQELTERLWTLLENPKKSQDQRFRAACALAAFAPDDPRWEKVSGNVAATLVIQKPFVIRDWMYALKGVGKWQIPPLADFLVDEKRSISERALIATVYGTYAADMPDAYARLERHLDEISGPDASVDTKIALAKRQASIGVALLVMGRGEKVWPLFQHRPDPTLRSYLIEWVGPGGVDAKVLTSRLEEEKEISARRAILLSLSEFGPDRLSQDQQLNLAPRLLKLYGADPDPGIHGAAAWLLRQWDQQANLDAIDEELRTSEWQLHEASRAHLTKEQKQRFSQLSREIEDIQRQLTDCEQTLSLRQAAWEQKLRAQLPASLQQGLIAHYPLDESKGLETINTVKDQPGGKYRGTGKPEWVPGVMGRALRLDGNGEIVGGSLPDLASNNAFSYGCWFLCEGKPAMIMVSNRDGDNGFRGCDLSIEPGYVLRMEIAGHDPDSLKAYYYNNASNLPVSLLSISVGAAPNSGLQSGWHHVLATYDGSTTARGVQIYVDGKLQPLTILRDKLTGSIKSEAGIHLGSRYGTYRFRGLLDDVRIYNRCLLAKEVSQLYAEALRIWTDEHTGERQLLRANTFRPLDDLHQRLTDQLVTANKSLREFTGDWWVRRWYINDQGQTMVVIPNAGEFWMGEGQERHQQQIGRSYAIASKEVTVKQFLRFLGTDEVEKLSGPTGDCPVNGVSWYDAAAYCNWLNAMEAIPEDQWCYLPNEAGEYAAGMKMAANYLQRTGYRLPTEAEWEHACRAGAETGYSFGESEDLLGKYGWFTTNSMAKSHPVGSLKGNDLGLFDMHGNDWEWCQDAYNDDTTDVNNSTNRVLRGGSFECPASVVRSAYRSRDVPTYCSFDIGFRPARTLPLGSFTALPPAPGKDQAAEDASRRAPLRRNNDIVKLAQKLKTSPPTTSSGQKRIPEPLRPNQEILKSLEQVLDTSTFESPAGMRLVDIIGRLNETLEKQRIKLPIVVDFLTFKEEDPDVYIVGSDFYDLRIGIPQTPRRLSVQRILDLAVGGIPTRNATWIVRKDAVEITTFTRADALRKERKVRQREDGK